MKMEPLTRFTPRVTKRTLVFTAACVWLFAGGMLLSKGVWLLGSLRYTNWWVIAGCIAGGIGFYAAMFSKISAKHISRIRNLTIEKPCFFSFFNFRSYLLMFLMIGTGITLRRLGFVPALYMALFYVVMGIPLFLSSVRFFYTAATFNRGHK